MLWRVFNHELPGQLAAMHDVVNAMSQQCDGPDGVVVAKDGPNVHIPSLGVLAQCDGALAATA